MAVIRLLRPAFDTSGGGGFAMDAPAGDPADPSTIVITPSSPVVITAASSISSRPEQSVLWVAFGLLSVAAVGAFLADQRDVLPGPLSLAPDMNAFALFYVATQGIERLLEPLTYFLKPTEPTKQSLDTKKAEAANAGAQVAADAAAQEAADAKAKLERLTSERAIIFWALASVIGVVVSAWLGLHFIAAVLSETSRAAIPQWVDVTATGLVIGGGTKVLHDLIGRLAKPATGGDD